MPLPDNYRPALSDDVPEGRACGNCEFYDEDVVNEDGERAWCRLWEDWVRGDHYCNRWAGDDEDEPQLRTDGGARMINSERGAGRQIRHYDLTDVEFRDDGPTGFTFEGVASVVDAPYEVTDMWGTYMETIRSGAFNKTLRDSKADVALFINHQTAGVPLATRGAKTLMLSADPNLHVVAGLDPSRPDVQTVRSAVTRGEMSQMSIGFYVPKARDKWNEDMTERVISEVQLVEVSIVWRGANPLTTGMMRSVDEFIDSLTNVDMTEDEVRRAIATLESRLPAVEPATTTDAGFIVTDDLHKLWESRATPAAWL